MNEKVEIEKNNQTTNSNKQLEITCSCGICNPCLLMCSILVMKLENGVIKRRLRVME